MESLESKLDRLSPEQRREVEDFVDFLMFRSGNFPMSLPGAADPVRIQNAAPPPLILQEPVHVLEDSPLKENDATRSAPSPVPAIPEEKAAPLQEIGPVNDDRITRDYMDYGQYDRSPSPATAAVKKVKEKLQKRAENEKPRVSLDWID
jgi:hypothetical protein